MLDLQIATQAKALPSEQQIRNWLAAVVDESDETSEITIRIVDEAESQQLNRDYRDKDRPTNVLSFPFQPPPGTDIPILGDLVICAPVVLFEAVEQQKSAEAHWAHMVIHGTLHLLGYDHIEAADSESMERREQEILAQLGYPNPYLSP